MTKQCTICPIGCATCTTALNCSVCRNVSGLSYFLLNNTCSITCPSGTYGGFDNLTCTSCSSPCQTCNGNTPSSCFTCIGGYNLIYGTNYCNSTCPDGQYANASVCSLCSINCVTCITNASNCLTCGLSFYGIDLYLHSTSCIAVCPVKFYPNITDHTCNNCDNTCYTCIGPGPTNCTSCTSGSL